MHAPASLIIFLSGCGRDFTSMKLRDGMPDYSDRFAAGRQDPEFAVAFCTFTMQSTGMFRLFLAVHKHPSATMLESL